MGYFDDLHRRLTRPGPLRPVEQGIVSALLPAAWLYGTIGRTRSLLYRRGILPSYRAPVPVLSVGNLSAGGTGKTPAVDRIVKILLRRGLRVAVVSRGFGVRVRGVAVISAGEGPLLPPAECGDEPYLLARRNPEAIVLASPRRRDGVRMAHEDFAAEVIVLDDGFQHFAVCRDLDIVLLDGRRPLGNGQVLPAGPLRESPAALQRADLFLLTRCPDPLPPDPVWGGKAVLHSRHVLGDSAVSLAGGQCSLSSLGNGKGVAFAGLADPGRFFSDLQDAGLTLSGRIALADHSPYGPAELEKIARAARSADYLITTEKDGVKLQGHSFPIPCYQVPLTLRVLEEEEFERRICSVLNRRTT